MVLTDRDTHRMTGEFICSSPEETFDLGEKVGESLKGGEVILLSGCLGAGKTLFTKGILRGLDYDIDEVTSPSFTLVNIYDARLKTYHLDLYRLDENTDIAFALGLEEMLDEKGAVIIIEWAERFKNFSFHKPVFSIEIEGDGDEPRKIRINETS